MIPVTIRSARFIIRFVPIVSAFTLTGCVSTTPVQVSEHTVYSPPLHWTVTTPPTWKFATLADVRKSERTSASTNQLFNYVMYQQNSAPFVSAWRAKRISTPMPVVFEIVREPLGEDRFLSDERIISQEMGAYVYIMPGTRVLGPTVYVKIAGKSFANGRLMYPLRLRDGSTFTLRREFWARREGHAAIVITAAYDVRDTEVASAEIQQIIRSISSQMEQADP